MEVVFCTSRNLIISTKQQNVIMFYRTTTQMMMVLNSGSRQAGRDPLMVRYNLLSVARLYLKLFCGSPTITSKEPPF